MTSMQDHILQDSKSFHQPNVNYAKRHHWYRQYHLWRVLKKSEDWHTSCWRHCCERRTCWWKDGLEPAMLWCDERLPDAALPSTCPQSWSNHQILQRGLQNILTQWARSETLKKSDGKDQVSPVLRVSVCLCASVQLTNRKSSREFSLLILLSHDTASFFNGVCINSDVHRITIQSFMWTTK